MKKIIISIVALALFALTFTAPWLWLDNGENIIGSYFFKGIDRGSFQKSKALCDCDGSCLTVQWMPFGAKVTACESIDYYYVPFWGQKFYRVGE